MRIGIDARMYSSKFTGIGRYTFELIKNLLEIDKKNDYVVFLNQNEFEYFTPSRDGVKKVKAPFPHYSFSEQTLFLRKLSREHLDLVHFTHFNAPLFYRKNTIVTIHDLTLSFFPGKKMTSLAHRLAYNVIIKNIIKRSSRIIAVSKNTKKDIETHFGIHPDKISVIYEGVNDNFQVIKSENDKWEVKNRYGLNKPFFLYTGVWRNHKNLVGLLYAFSILKNVYNIDCELVITGKKDSLYHEVTDTVKDLDLESQVKFLGLVNEKELVILYNLAELYIFPSFYEGFGLPPLESMACGTPVVCSNTSSLPEICGKNAVFFNPYDPRDIAQKILKTYKNKELKQRLIASGFDHLNKFSWKKMAEETLKLYEENINI